MFSIVERPTNTLAAALSVLNASILLSLAVQEEPEIAERPRASISRETKFRVDSSSDSNL
jgi:hypothetical protein